MARTAMAVRRALTATLAFAALTALTQVGGLAYLLYRLLRSKFRWPVRRRAVLMAGLFLACYGAVWAAAFLAAPVFGREPLPCFKRDGATLAMASPVYCVLNRHYVRPKTRLAAEALADTLARRFPGTITLAFDGAFPFFDGFAMLPHLSHDDGRKLDLAFWYAGLDGAYLCGRTRSPIGYWAFEQPSRGGGACPEGAWPTLRWNLSWLQPLFPDRPLEPKRTRAALQWLKQEGPRYGVVRVFAEPHLARRLGVSGGVLRFQGCRAARHDDHIHLSVR